MWPHGYGPKVLSGTAQPGSYRASDTMSGDSKVPLSDLGKWAKFSSNGDTHCAIDADGRLWGWGNPPCGDGTFFYRHEPVLVSDEQWADVSVGRLYGQLAASNQVLGAELPLEVDAGGTQESGGLQSATRTYVLAVKSDGSLWGWGANSESMLGLGTVGDPAALIIRTFISSAISHAEASSDFVAARTNRWNDETTDEIVVLKHDADDPGQGAELKAVVTRYVHRVDLLSGGSGYRSPPRAEIYAVDDNEVEVPLNTLSDPVSLSAEMRYSVVGAEITSAGTVPYKGTVAVVFSEGIDGDTAAGTCQLSQGGFVQSISMTHGGTYSSPPTISIRGTGGDASASPVLSGYVRSIVGSGGEYREKKDNLKFRFVDPEGHNGASAVGKEILSYGTLREIEVANGGSGYTCPPGGSLLAVAVLKTGHQSTSGRISIGEGRYGVEIGRCYLAPSSVASISQKDLFFGVPSGAIPEDGKVRVPNVLGYLNAPAHLDPFEIPHTTRRTSGPPTAEIVWPGTDIQPVSLTVTDLGSPENPNEDTRSWRISLGSQIQDAFLRTKPYVKVTSPAVALVWSSFTPPSLQNPVVSAWPNDPVVVWSPGRRLRQVAGLPQSSYSKIGEFALGDILQSSGIESHIVGDGNPFIGGSPLFLYETATESPLTVQRYALASTGEGIPPDEYTMHYFGGESSVRAATISHSISGSPKVFNLSITDGGEGYRTEPYGLLTNIRASPVKIDDSRQYSSAVAEGHSSFALSGGKIYEWGLSANGRARIPSERGYPLRIDVAGVPGNNAGSVIAHTISPILDPQAAWSGLFPAVPHSSGFDASALYLSEPWARFGGYTAFPVRGHLANAYRSGVVHTDSPATYLTSYSGSSVSFYVESGFLTAPSTDGLCVPATATVLRPAEPIKAIYEDGAHAGIVAMDGNDDLWLIGSLGASYQEDDYVASARDLVSIPAKALSGSVTYKSRITFTADPNAPFYTPATSFISLEQSDFEMADLPSATEYVFSAGSPHPVEIDRVVLMPQLTGPYPKITLPNDPSEIRVTRTGGKVVVVKNAGVKKITSSQQTGGKPPPPDYWQSGWFQPGDYIECTITESWEPEVSVIDLPDAEFSPSILYEDSVSQTFDGVTFKLSDGMDFYVFNGRPSSFSGRFGSIESIFGSSYASDVIFNSPSQSPGWGQAELGVSILRYFSDRPQYTLHVGSTQIPLVLKRLQKTPHLNAVKANDFQGSSKRSESYSMSELSDGTLMARGGLLTSARRLCLSDDTQFTRIPTPPAICSPLGIHVTNGSSRPSHVSNIDITVNDAGADFTTIPRVIPDHSPEPAATVEALIDGKVKSIGIESGGSGFLTPPLVEFVGKCDTKASAEAIIEGGLLSIDVTATGSGYVVPPKVTLEGLGVHGSAVASLGTGGVVASISVTSAGTYRSPPSVKITPDTHLASISVTSGGSEYTSPPRAVICPPRDAAAYTLINAAVTEVSVTVAGRGYSDEDPPIIEFFPIGGGPGSGATAAATINPETGEIISVNVTNGGSMYQAPPAVVVRSTTGEGAVLSAKASGPLNSVVVTSVGSGFSSPPAILFQGGGGTGASAQATIAADGSGATATAKISGKVVSVKILDEGSGYQSSPQVFFTGGGNESSDEAKQKLTDGEITLTEYNSTSSVAVAQARIEGLISDVAVTQEGKDYSITGNPFSEGADAKGVYPEASAACGMYKTQSFGDYSEPLGGSSFNGEPIVYLERGRFVFFDLPNNFLSAPSTYPGGGVSEGQWLPIECGLWTQQPDVIVAGGHFFYVDAIENARTAAIAIRKEIDFTTSRVGSSSIGFYSQGGEYAIGWHARIGDLKGKKINFPVVSGSLPAIPTVWYAAKPLLFMGGLSLLDFRFSQAPEFVVEDIYGSGAVISSEIDGTGKVSSIEFTSDGTLYTDRTALRLKSIALLAQPCTATCVVSQNGSVSHVDITASGGGFINPVAVAYDGRGSGCLLRAVKSRSVKPSGIGAIEVINGGSGYSAESPPLVFVYEADDLVNGIPAAFTAAARSFPIRSNASIASDDNFSSESNYGMDVFATFTSGKITEALPIAESLARRKTVEECNDFWARLSRFPGSGVFLDQTRLTYREPGDAAPLPRRPRVDIFSRFDRIKSVRHKCHSSLMSMASVPAVSPYSSPPVLGFSGAICSTQPLAAATLAVLNAATLACSEPRFSGSDARYFIDRTQ